jgi:DNA-binding NarL/FixJ family response regulator
MDTDTHRAALTVFLVEDAASVRRNIAQLLELLAGVRIVGEAEDGKTALEAICVCRPDVVVIDLRLAAGSGIDLISALAQRLPEVVTIALTNHSGSAFRAACNKAGAHYFFDKTAEFDAACNTIRDLSLARRWRAID